MEYRGTKQYKALYNANCMEKVQKKRTLKDKLKRTGLALGAISCLVIGWESGTYCQTYHPNSFPIESTHKLNTYMGIEDARELRRIPAYRNLIQGQSQQQDAERSNSYSNNEHTW